MSKQRHRWQQHGHPYRHEKICVKCGCIKETILFFNTVYWLNGDPYAKAPVCIPKPQDKGGNEE